MATQSIITALVIAGMIFFATPAAADQQEPGVCSEDEWTDASGNSGERRDCVVVIQGTSVCVGYSYARIDYADGAQETASSCTYRVGQE